MKYVKFGATGLQVSQLCLGTMTFGIQCDEETSRSILDEAFAGGITFIDTADTYPLGRDGSSEAGLTEEIIGRWMKGRRDEVILASKFYFPVGPARWDQGGSRKHIMNAIDATLRRLDTDYVDLYQIHMWDRHTPIDETLGALDDLVRAGKVRYIGCSNHDAWHLARAIGRSEALGFAKYQSVQPRYNLLFRNIERELLPLAEHDNIAVIPYNPIAAGLLSGKHAGNAEPTAGTRFAIQNAGEMYRGRYWAEDKFRIVEELRPIAAEAGMTMVQLAVAWVLANPLITAPIIGASRPGHLADSLAALNTPLDADLKTRLDDLTEEYRTVDVDR